LNEFPHYRATVNGVGIHFVQPLDPIRRERLRIDPGRVLGGHGLLELDEAGAEVLEDSGGDALALAGQAHLLMFVPTVEKIPI
jgi:hypothetical protein